MTDKKSDEAPAAFAKAQRAEDGKKAMAEYEATAVALRVKTERLRAMRLAREAEAAKTAPPAKKKAGKAAAGTKAGKAGKKGKGASGTLSDWLDQQEKGGRRS